MMYLIFATVWAGFAMHDYVYCNESWVFELIIALVNLFIWIVGWLP